MLVLRLPVILLDESSTSSRLAVGISGYYQYKYLSGGVSKGSFCVLWELCAIKNRTELKKKKRIYIPTKHAEQADPSPAGSER